MTEMEDLKELFRAELGIVRAEMKGLGDDIKEVKEVVRGFSGYCGERHGDVTERIGRLETEQAASNRERKMILAGLSIALTGAAKAFFDWITK